MAARRILARIKPRHVVVGAVVYGAATIAAYEYFKKDKPKPGAVRPLTEDERLGRFNANAEKYDDDVEAVEKRSGILKLRAKLLSRIDAPAAVLEVGVGTGRNLEFFPPKPGVRVTGVDKATGMLEKARARAISIAASRPPDACPSFTFEVGDAAALPYPTGGEWDYVVDTFGLCSYEDPVAALREMRRVLKPGGQLLLLEHGRSSRWRVVNRLLDASNEGHVCKHGCAWNREILSIVEAAGLKVLELDTTHLGTTYYIVAQ